MRCRIGQFLCMTTSLLITMNVCAGGYNYDSQEFRTGPILKVNNDSEDEFSRSGKETYLYGGYLFTYRFLTNKQQTLTGPSGARVSYAVNGVTPRAFHGIEIGIGKALERNLDLQLAYVQQFTRKKTGTISGMSSNNTISMQGMDVNVLWIFNPDDEIQVGAKIGARIADFREKVVLNGSDYYPVDDSTEINPRIGIDVIWQFDKSFALRTGIAYNISAYRVFYNGDMGAFAGLSYTL